VDWYWLVCKTAYSSYIQCVNTDMQSVLRCISVLQTKKCYSTGKFEDQCVSHLTCWNMMWLMKTNSGNKLFIIIFFKKCFSCQIVPRTILPCISIFNSQTLRIHIMKYKKYDICGTSLLYLILFYFINNTRILSIHWKAIFSKEVKFAVS
jgi:hypothetical protein